MSEQERELDKKIAAVVSSTTPFSTGDILACKEALNSWDDTLWVVDFSALNGFHISQGREVFIDIKKGLENANQ